MLLNRKIPASSLAEVVIAIAVIALCFGVASLVFVRSVKVSANFQDVKKQTEIQSKLWEAMHEHEELEEWEDLKVDISAADEHTDTMKVVTFLGTDERVVWQQQRLNGDKKGK